MSWMDGVIFSTSLALVATFSFLLAKPFDERILLTFAFSCAVYLGVDDFLTGLPTTVESLDLLGDHWNWTGKLLSLALSALMIVVLRLSPVTIGLTLEQRHKRIGLIALVLFVVWGACLGLLFRPGAPDAETLAFQLTMPGLAEELVFRGIAPALLLGLIGRRGPIEGIPWVVIVATSVIFGALHGLSYSQGKFGFDVLSALFPFIGSIPGGWLRFKTGSLVFPILAHSLANVAFHIAGGLGA